MAKRAPAKRAAVKRPGANKKSSVRAARRPAKRASKQLRNSRPPGGSTRPGKTARPASTRRRGSLHGPETYTIFTVTPQDIGGLDAKRAVDLIADLLWAETRRLGIPTTRVQVSRRITVPDGGVDASVADATDSWPDSFLFGGLTVFQIKAGTDFKPWQKAALKRELFGTKSPSNAALAKSVKTCLEADGTYILVCTGTDPVQSEMEQAEAHLEQLLRQAGFPDADMEVWGQSQLIGLLQRFPSLALKVTGNARADFQTHDAWAGHAEMRRALTIGTTQETFIESVRSELRRGDGPVHVRVRGEPGIGKTRLVLETTKADDLRPLVIYCDKPAKLLSGELMTTLLRDDTPVDAIVVVDECDFGSQTLIWNQLQQRSPRIKLVSIYNDPEEPTGTTVTQNAPPLNEAHIADIISGYDVPKNQAQQWAGLCDGSPRVAHVIGQNLKHNPDDLLRQPDTVNVWDRYIAGDDDPRGGVVAERRLVLHYLALFKRFGFLNPVSAEAKAIAQLIERENPAITWPRFRAIVRELQQRKILQGDVTLYITPRLLHIKLWVEWWDSHGDDLDLIALIQNLPDKLADWFREMFRYARESKAALRVTEALLDENSPYASLFFEDGRAVRFFRALTDAAPNAALQTLQRTVGTWTVEQLRAFTGDQRRYVVWSLEAIAVWDESFQEAARLLLRLAEAENENISNNATGVFAELFSPAHGSVAPTEAPPEKRFPVLQEALESTSAAQRRVGLRAAAEGLKTGFFSRMVGAEYQGLRRPPALWTPKTWGEVFDAYRRVWRLLVDRLEALDSSERAEAVGVLAGATRGLLLIGNLFDLVVDSLEMIANRYRDHRSQVVGAIETSLHYDGKALPEKNRTRLARLREELVESDFHSRLERYAGMTPVQDNFDEDGNYVEDKLASKIVALAKQAVSEPHLLAEELRWLVSDAARNSFRFGQELANVDDRFGLLSTLVDALKTFNADNAFFVSGYFSVVFQRDQALWETTLERMARDDSQRRYVPEVTWRSGMTEAAALRLLKLLESGHIDASALRMFSFGGAVRRIPEHVFVQWLDRLTGISDRAAASTALHLFHFYYTLKDPDRVLPREVTLAVLTAEAFFRPDERFEYYKDDDWDWLQIASAFLNQFPEAGVRIAERMVEAFGEEGTITGGYHNQVEQVLQRVAKASPSEVWNAISQRLGPPIDSRAFRLKNWLREGGLAAMRPEDVWSWVDANVDKRAWYAATFVPPSLVRSEADVSWAHELLVRYGDREDVRRNLHANFGTEGWSGPASAHYEGKRQSLQELKSAETNRNVRQWLDESIRSLEYRIKQEKVFEEREF